VSVAAVVLAAGGGSRFAASGGDGHKLLVPFGGRAVVEWAIEHAVGAALDDCYVVWGATELPVPRSTTGKVQLLENERWRDGIATSLQVGIVRAERDGHDAVVVGLGDQPRVSTDAWVAVASATERPIAVATYSGVPGNPVRLAASVWDLLPTTGDAGARVVSRAHPELVTEVACAGEARDIDTIDDLLADDGHPGDGLTDDGRTGAEQWS
jgi:CTP:molybdopterin cytidylyltransferase MocA